MGEKITKAATEIQLGFAFFTDTARDATSGAGSTGEAQPRYRRTRSGGAPQSLEEALVAAHTLLLAAPLPEVNAQLFSLLEFCEAALTRALDAVPTRQGVPFSDEEYRSLRGIGHAQWLLAEEQSTGETKPTVPRPKKSKKMKSEAGSGEAGES